MYVRSGAALIALPVLIVFAGCDGDGLSDPGTPVVVETEGLVEAIEGQPYSQELEATGGSGEYTWTVASGSLPAGLTLLSSGTLSGTPAAPGTSTFRVQATDDDGESGTADLSLAVTQALAVHTATLPEAVVGVAYTHALVAVGGRPDHVWSRTGGTAGGWLTISAAGTLAGTPEEAGSQTVTLAVTDASEQEATRELILVVLEPVAVATTTLPAATEGRVYGAQLEAAGGDGLYTWSIDAGALPDGLQLGSAGAITGSPEAAGTFTFTVEVVDGVGRSATAELTLEVEAAPTIQTTLLPPAEPGEAYSAALEATGGTGDYTWSITAGALPDGLALSAAGVISGTAAAEGTASFTVRVLDEAGAAHTRELELPVVSDVVALESGVAVPGLDGDEESVRYFVLDVPSGAAEVSFAMTGGTGDADLYIRRGGLPQQFAYDCRPLREGNEETCTVQSPAAGPWYVMIRGFEAYEDVTLTATVEP